PGRRSAGQDATARRHAPLCLDPGIATGKIDRDIDAGLAGGVPDRTGKLGRLHIVDNVISPERLELLALLRTGRAGEDLAADHLGELDAGDANTAAGAQNEDLLAGLDLAAREQ